MNRIRPGMLVMFDFENFLKDRGFIRESLTSIVYLVHSVSDKGFADLIPVYSTSFPLDGTFFIEYVKALPESFRDILAIENDDLFYKKVMNIPCSRHNSEEVRILMPLDEALNDSFQREVIMDHHPFFLGNVAPHLLRFQSLVSKRYGHFSSFSSLPSPQLPL